MKFQEFKKLDETVKELICWNYGVEIAAREDKWYSYTLYQVDGFYIEVIYNKPSHTVRQFSAFESMTLLEPYLVNMNIEHVYHC